MSAHNQLVTLYSAVTSAQSAPTDTTIPVDDQTKQTSNGVRGDRFMAEFDLYGSSGTVTATIRPYLWDGKSGRWVKSAASISLSNSQTSSGPASREAHYIDSIAPYNAIAFVVEAISGTGATIACKAAAR